MNKVKNANAKHYELYHALEAIDVMKAVLTPNEYIGYLKGNCLKYQLRLGKKDNIDKDMEKIADYRRELDSILLGE